VDELSRRTDVFQEKPAVAELDLRGLSPEVRVGQRNQTSPGSADDELSIQDPTALSSGNDGCFSVDRRHGDGRGPVSSAGVNAIAQGFFGVWTADLCGCRNGKPERQEEAEGGGRKSRTQGRRKHRRLYR
jgi:hypothetical protein